MIHRLNQLIVVIALWLAALASTSIFVACGEGQRDKSTLANLSVLASPSTFSRATRQAGQLESFNSEVTGLGDLEAQDELKKMLKKRSLQPGWPRLNSTARDGDKINSTPVRGSLLNKIIEPRRKEYLMSLARRQMGDGLRVRRQARSASVGGHRMGLKRSLYALQRIDNPDGQVPILIDRRTKELLQQPDGPEAQQQGEQVGEFGSRISLLTTRKMMEPEQLDSQEQANNFANYGKQRRYIDELRAEVGSLDDDDESEPIISRVLIDPVAINRPLETLAEEDEEPPARSFSSNYLPRVARNVRKFTMK